MIKFFRKIRQQLLTENKFSKYLLYAIGETVLVVIGILIALNINNSNQERINEAEIKSILKEIQQDLKSDIERSKQVFDFYIEDDSIAYLITENKTVHDNYKLETIDYYRLGYTYIDFVINSNGYDNYVRNLDKVPEKYQSIHKDLKNLYMRKKSNIEVYNLRIRETVYKNIDASWKQNNWKLQERKGIVPDEAINYYLKDPQYKNLVGMYMEDREGIVRASQDYQFKALETYAKIQELIESTDSIPNILVVAQKTENLRKSVVGTYKIKDATLVGWAKKIKISNEGDALHLIDESYLGVGIDFKLAHHKASIFVIPGSVSYVKFNTLGEADLVIKREDLGYTATYRKEE
jgi:hypothetical protein